MTKTINQDHKEYHRIDLEVRNRFDKDFNFIQFDVVKKTLGEDCIFENITRPSQNIITEEWLDHANDEQELVKEYEEETETKRTDDLDAWLEWLYEKRQDEIEEYWNESEHYPMWNTIFEARDQNLSDWIGDHIDDLYNIGIGVMTGDREGLLNNMLFISGAGYSFFHEHWIPLYTGLLKWVKIEQEIKA